MKNQINRYLSTEPFPVFVVAAAWILTAVLNTGFCESDKTPVLTWGDQADGTYKNPILNADYSDPDVIRVGQDFYLAASDFHFVGIQILHSVDLVNWQIIGQVFNQLSMDDKYDRMQGYAQGTWAPSLRYHNNQFYLYVCTPYDGLFMWHTRDPAGPWSETVTVKKVSHWEDPCPFWDDDGKAYLVHSLVGAGPLILHRMSEDGTALLDDGVEIYRGPVAEGPKMFKRNGWYYISLPENGVAEGGQTLLRSKDIYGPYERRVVLPNGSPHQGGLVELENGQAWFIGFQCADYLGRVCHLLPVQWNDDGWAVFGENGNPVTHWKKPAVGKTVPVMRPQTSDDFDSETLSAQWQWNHNPVNEAWSLTDRPGWLRLKALPADNLAGARNTLTQKIWGQNGHIEMHLDISKLADGQYAGLTFISGRNFGWLAAAQTDGKRHLTWQDQSNAVSIPTQQLWLRGAYAGSDASLSYSFDGITFTKTPIHFKLQFGDWKGARFGIFSFGSTGIADIDSVHYDYQ